MNSVICRQRDQHILLADAPVEVIEQFRKNAIEANRLILRLPALRAEQMIDVVVAGPADRENIRNAGRIVAEVLSLDGSLDKIKGQQVAERRPHHRIIVGLTRLLGAADDWMRKACPEVLVLRGPWPII
jgi:hypothetical protein